MKHSESYFLSSYMGRSTGTGAVSVWMHNLQNITWLPNYKSPIYSGPAVKAYAGVRGIDLATFVSKEGYTVVSGECPVRTLESTHLL